MTSLIKFCRSLSAWQIVVLIVAVFLVLEGLARAMVWIAERLQKHGR